MMYLKSFHKIIFPFISLCMWFVSSECQAYEKIYGELSASLGLVNVSFSEVGSKLTGLPNISDPEGGAVSVIAANFHYKFNSYYNSSWYASGTVPFITSDSDSYFSLGGGYEYYFSKVGNKTAIKDQGTIVKMTPKFHYFVGGELNMGYLVYTTEEAQKNDVLFELGAMGGAVYAWKKKWALRGQLSISKGIGVVTSTFGIKAFLGGTSYLED